MGAGRGDRVTAAGEAGVPAGRGAGAGGDVAAAFKAFEAGGWSARAGTYGALMARATAFAIEPLLDAAQVGPGVRVLDVGCGPGALSAAAAARGALVTGADLAEGMLAQARRNHPELEFVHADAEDLPFADGAFDVAVGAFIVNHLPHPERAAAELERVARRVALAMWGPQDEVAIFGLPTRAAEGLVSTAPPGPDEQRFADAAALAALIGGSVHEAPAHAARRHARCTLGRHPRRDRPHLRPALGGEPGTAGGGEGTLGRARRALPDRDRLRAADHDPDRRPLSCDGHIVSSRLAPG